MKVQNISFLKQNFNIKRQNSALNYSNIQPLKYDSVSFGQKIVSKAEVEKLQSEAVGQLKLAGEIFNQSEKVVTDGKEMLLVSKDAFLLALKDIEAIKKIPHTGMLINPEGNILSFTFEVGDEVALQYSESTPEGKLVRLVTAKNFIPQQISEFDGSTANIYTYNGDNISVTKNINVTNDDFGKCDGVFGYKNGVLNRASINGNPTKTPTMFENVYFFDNKSNLKIGSVQYTNMDNGYSCVAEVLFDNNGRVNTIFNNYDEDGKMGMKWARSYHFMPGGLVARLNCCEQPYGLDKIYFNDAIYPNREGRYVTNSDSSCFGDGR